MKSGKANIIPILAMIVLFIGIVSSVYVNAIENEGENNFRNILSSINGKDYAEDDYLILVNGNVYSFDELFNQFQTMTIETDDGEKTGIPLDLIILFSGVSCTSCNSYTFKASDPYQQTLLWDDVQTGILTFDGTYNARVYFPNTAHSYWVFNLVEIEVNNL
jgi:hypothetical protein